MGPFVTNISPVCMLVVNGIMLLSIDMHCGKLQSSRHARFIINDKPCICCDIQNKI